MAAAWFFIEEWGRHQKEAAVVVWYFVVEWGATQDADRLPPSSTRGKAGRNHFNEEITSVSRFQEKEKGGNMITKNDNIKW